MFDLNPASGLPIYRQIAEQIHRLVESGQLRPGDELPSVRQVAGEHAVNPMTVSRAYSLLETEGLLERQRGKPMRVAPGAELIRNRRRRLERLQPALRQLALEARQLGLGSDEIVRALRDAMKEDAA